MATPARVHDPLFHFETHFPERLSRLHLNPEFVGGGSNPVQRKSRKSRAARECVRYKTQPVTFDEIQEVDEENIKDEDKTDGLRNQFAALSKSMEGLLIKRISRKGNNDTIEEVVDDVQNGTKLVKPKINEFGRANSESLQRRLKDDFDEGLCQENKENEASVATTSDVDSMPVGLPQSCPNTRRQRPTAKAKKRQMQVDVHEGGDKGT